MNEPRESDIPKVIRQEELLVFRSFDEADAWNLGCALREEAEKYDAGLVIDIRSGNQILFNSFMPGATIENIDWVRKKINLVQIMKTSSYLIGLEVKFGIGEEKIKGLSDVDYAWHGGCFPIRLVTGEVVALVTVSGLPQRDDHKLVTDVIADYLGVDLGENAI
jgi:uncharacterized protein (UPF0303 family)